MTVMPFGLVNSQATFQRLMDNTLKGLDRVESYIDDCIIFSTSFEEHLTDLRDVFERLEQANIRVKYRKCQFGFDEVEFLGHLVSERGRRPTPTAAQKLAKFPTPKSVGELQRFLGSINFYRSYIPNLAGIAKPLYDLMKKGRSWEWTEQRDDAFQQLRSRLAEEPVLLAFPNWSREFVVETDASSNAVAGVLSQRDPLSGDLRPIDYFSSSLTSSQRNYSAGQLEAWGLIAACRKWRTYLRGSDKVELLTDHNPLRWLRSQKDPRHTFARWIMELEEYDYVISYRPGRENALPDYLSRVPGQRIDLDIQDENSFEDKVFNVRNRSRQSDIIKLQKRDPVTRGAIECIGAGEDITSGQLKRVASHLNLRDGVLYFDQRLVVPKALQHAVVEEVHRAGHFGQARTSQMIRRTYFWIGMTRDIKEYCRDCLTCHRGKPSNTPKEPVGTFNTSGIGPGDLIAMDVATLPWSDDTYRYFLCMVDVFTRYIEAVPLKDQKAESLVREFENGWIYRGHGVPKGVLSDQAHNIDGGEVREMCRKFGIEKRHTSPYHPQADGLAERSIGIVKQVARCLTLDRNLSKGSWPSLLPEITFYCNNIENSSTKFSAQLLMTGRQPISPVDAMLATYGKGKTESYEQHLHSLTILKNELHDIARSNDETSKDKRQERTCVYRKQTQICPGDYVLERNEMRTDSLDLRYKGPFQVIDCRGHNIKINRQRGSKWVHKDRCKLYKRGGGEVVSIPIQEKSAPEYIQNDALPELDITLESESEEQPAAEENPRNDPANGGQPEEPPNESTGNIAPSVTTNSQIPNQQRRYPLRIRKAKEYRDYLT